MTRRIEDAIRVYAAFHPADTDPTQRIEALGLSDDAVNRALVFLADEAGLLQLTFDENDILRVSYDLMPGISREEGLARLDGFRARNQAGDAVTAG